MPKPTVVNLDHYRNSGEVVPLDGAYEYPKPTPFDSEQPHTQMPAGDALSEPLPAHIRERREAIKDRKENKERNRKFGKSIVGSVVVMSAALALMNHNSKSPEESPDKVPITIEQGDHNLTEALERTYKDAHPGQPVDMVWVTNEANLIVEREKNGSSLVHEGETYFADPPN
jgi:hypothetical protein